MTLDDIKQALVQKLEQAQKETPAKTEAVANAKYALWIADNQKSKIEETVAAIMTSEEGRQKVVAAAEALKKQMEAQKKKLEPAAKVFLRMKKDNKDFWNKLTTHETAIQANAGLKDKLATPLKDTLTAIDAAEKLFGELCQDLAKIDAALVETSKQVEAQKETIKDPFAIDLTAETTEATTNYSNAKTDFDTAIADEKVNQNEVITLKERLKLF